MVSLSIIEEVLSEQKAELEGMSSRNFRTRKEEQLIDLQSHLAQVVIGVRRSGKSVLCYNRLAKSGKLFGYVNFDDERFRDMTSSDLNNVLLILHKIYGDFEYLMMDEVQNVEGWHLFVNRLLRTNMHVIITGSNAKLLGGELATHLTGRHKDIELFPFSFADYCDYMGVDRTSVTTKARAFRLSSFDEYLKQGGFPELLTESDHKTYVDVLVNNVIQNDIFQRHKVSYKAAFKNLTHHILNNVPVKIVGKELQELFGFKSNHTAENYVEYDRQAYLISLCKKYSPKSSKRVRDEKAYPIDVALMNKRADAFSGDNLGWRLESVVYIELLRRNRPLGRDVYYYEEASGEADFIVCDGRDVLEIYQVSYDIDNERTFKREIKGLRLASKATRCKRLWLITRLSNEDYVIDDDTIFIRPACEWLIGKE